MTLARSRSDGSPAFKDRRRLAVAILLVLITALAAILRFWRLGSVPPGFHYDEALDALEAWRVLTLPGYHYVYFPGDFGLAPMFIYLSSLVFRLFSPSPEVSRAITATIGTLTVPAVYALGRELALYDDRMPPAAALLAAAVLAVLRWHITFSRVAIEGILVPLFLVLVLWALLRGLRTNSRPAWLALGLTLGLSLYSYPAAWLLPPLVIFIIGYLALTNRARLAGRGRGLAGALLIAALVAIPLAVQFAGHPAQLLMRTEQVAAVNPAGPAPSALAEIGGNLVKALGMFTFAGDTDPRSNIPGMPALDPLLSIPFCIGVGLAAWRWKRPAMGILLLAGLLMLANTVFSQYAPHFRRALGLTPIVALLSGVGLAAILGPLGTAARGSAQAGSPSRRLLPAMRALAVVALLLGSAIWSVNAYFGRWGGSPDLFYAYDEGLWQIAGYVKSLPADQEIFITPRPARDATLAFAWRTGPVVRHFDGRHAVVAPAAGRAATFIVIEHEDFRATELLRKLYPEAIEAKTFLDREGKVYARALHVPAGTSPGRGPGTASSQSWPGVELLGYDLDAPAYHPGDTLYLQLWWRVTAPATGDWTVFTHVLGPPHGDGGIVWAGQDGKPGGGSVPTPTWQVGDTILDEYQIQLGKDLPSGKYQLEVGLYNPADGGKRLPTLQPPGQDHAVIGEIEVN